MKLTPRQTEIMRLLASGFADKEIANKLGIKVSTVRFHLREVFARLKSRHRAHAMALFLPITLGR